VSHSDELQLASGAKPKDDTPPPTPVRANRKNRPATAALKKPPGNTVLPMQRIALTIDNSMAPPRRELNYDQALRVQALLRMMRGIED